ncbi:MAG: tryptophan 2,3-dioxygenase [Bacteroidetes bacterium]|uniref:Tryptophan 2,3-dioxygenase n=1 Tax=Phaeocystidibacter marisrubri TaxID=1577780 RepID=A0A6L3ZH16_9FLAO|nr:tryptophan 2,3-dioxygenase family protein [Phaeocystidibacter marisrubri]KAB2816868.1 tryptophan 2,3-dioxygenase [Phaeocystidibacter marisrubri]TNE29879.1 MAG: tryptophan 2,3-dioxygenase [Bacteroidota bacterium]GGH77809.1 tryptophan 2,3-dioxygenase [Phaeocystidibacter marisrubri]
MEFSADLKDRIEKLSEKYQASGQELIAFLDGLLYADYITYWDYIHLDTLLSLQTPRTPIPDEEIFIMYHQITELYFKLSLHELKQVKGNDNPTVEFLTEKVRRINRYFEVLTHSFNVMVEGMDRAQFLKFRMALIPASGFQSVQYRMIEIASTDFIRLVKSGKREKYNADSSTEEMYKDIYWQDGATIAESGEKTLTLRQFEEKYSDELIRMGRRWKGQTLWQRYLSLSEEDRQNETLLKELKQLDVNVNINWPLEHYRSAVRYLAKQDGDVRATGGTNWQKYLPPRFQKRIFYPEIWTDHEKEEWGRGWVNDVLNDLKAK